MSHRRKMNPRQRRRARERRRLEEARQVVCKNCGQPAEFIADSSEIYHGRNYGPLWICRPCKAWVGCHKGTKIPLGRLADAELRVAKMAAHGAFDRLWKHGGMTRTEAYKWLTQAMGRTEQVHIGEMDVADCKLVVDLCRGRVN